MERAENEDQQGFWCFISTQLLREVSPGATILFGFLLSLVDENGICSETNNFFSEKLNLTSRAVSRDLALLEDRGWLIREILRNERNQVMGRKIHVNLKKSS